MTGFKTGFSRLKISARQPAPWVAGTLLPREDDKNKYRNNYLRLVSNYGIARSCSWQKYVFHVPVIKRLDASLRHLELPKVINPLVTLKDNPLPSTPSLTDYLILTHLLARAARGHHYPNPRQRMATHLAQRSSINPKALQEGLWDLKELPEQLHSFPTKKLYHKSPSGDLDQLGKHQPRLCTRWGEFRPHREERDEKSSNCRKHWCAQYVCQPAPDRQTDGKAAASGVGWS